MKSLPAEINPRADWHLAGWADWMRGYRYAKGYPSKSAMLACGGGSGEDEFEVMCAEADNHAARIVDAIIDGLTMPQQCAIRNVYCASVWRFRGDPMVILIEAVEAFWLKAQRQGLS